MIVFSSNGNYAEIPHGAILSIFVIVLAIALLFYLLRSFGLYKLAARGGVKNAWFSFIPCLWMYTACKIIGKSKLFGKSFESLAIWFFLLFTFAAAIPLTYNGILIGPYIGYLLKGNTVTIVVGANSTTISPMAEYPRWILTLLDVFSIASYFMRIAEIFIAVTVYVNLFRKFWPEHYILAAVLSFMGLFGPFVFAIRNRKEVNFAEYIRRRFYSAGYPPYGPYGPYGGGQGTPNAGATGEPFGDTSEKNDDPFGEFSDKPDDPFGEFSDKDGKNDG